MSRPMLPGQNSKYWGYDLNNYLLSLENKISGLESFHQNQQTIVQNVGPGFYTGEWVLTTTKEVDGVITTASIIDYTLTGKCSYEAYVSGSIRSYVHEFTSHKIFEKVYVVEYNSDGKLSYPNGTSEIDNLQEAFHAVYLFFERDEDGNSNNVKTLFCKDYIFRGDCIMIGSYEKQGKIFTPRVQSSSKTLYQSGQDTIKPSATVTIKAGSLSTWPTISAFNERYYFYINGINPEAVLNNYNEDTPADANYDVKIGIFSDSNTTVHTGTGTSEQLGCYYLAPSGNLYVQYHSKPHDWPTVKDYTLEASDPLTGKDGYTTGGLVYIGCVYVQTKNTEEGDVLSYEWVSAKQNGISPVIMDVDNSNPHKILIENNQYWVGNEWYNIDIDENNNGFSIKKKGENIGTIILNDSYAIPSGKSILFYPDNTSPKGPRPNGALRCSFEVSNSPVITLSTFNGGSAGQTWNFKQENGEFETNKLLVKNGAAITGETAITGNASVTGGFAVSGKFSVSDDFGIMVGKNVYIGKTLLDIDTPCSLAVNGNTILTGDTTITGKTKFIVPVSFTEPVLTVYMGDDTKESNKVFNFSGEGFKFFGSVSCTDITFTSDIRLKTNLKPINSKICHDAVQNLNVNTYTYIKNNYDTLGLIAQEIEEQLPEYSHLLVHENEDGEKMVSEHKLLFILWEALKQEIKERKGGK